MLSVSAFEDLIVSPVQVSGTVGRLGSHPILVLIHEVSYAVYVIFTALAPLFVNLAANTLHLASKQLIPPLRFIFIVATTHVALIADHLIERPAPERSKLWLTVPHPHKLATAHAR
jgi:peptidoglycan/LPS O-acetylase OafA/YrhL